MRLSRENSIDVILTECFQAAKDQGAFGDIAGDLTEGEGEPQAGNAQIMPLSERLKASDGSAG
jgi:hypothetical protein